MSVHKRSFYRLGNRPLRNWSTRNLSTRLWYKQYYWLLHTFFIIFHTDADWTWPRWIMIFYGRIIFYIFADWFSFLLIIIPITHWNHFPAGFWPDRYLFGWCCTIIRIIITLFKFWSQIAARPKLDTWKRIWIFYGRKIAFIFLIFIFRRLDRDRKSCFTIFPGGESKWFFFLTRSQSVLRRFSYWK